MKKHVRFIAMILAAASFLTYCNKDYFEMDRLSDEMELEPELAAPLAYGSMTLEDIVERIDSMGYTEVDEEGLIYLVYSDTAFSVMADTMVEIPDKLYSEYYIDTEINTPIWLGSGIGDTVHFFKTEKFEYEMEGNDRLDSVIIKGGQVVIDVASSFNHTGILTVSSSHIRNVARDTFVSVFEISDLSGGFIDQQVFDTDDYFLETSESNDTSYIEINFDLALINSGNPVNPDDECEILTSFLDLDFYRVFGYIESRDLIDENGSIDIPLYENNPDLANLRFADPRINLFVSNSVGVPMEVEMDNVIATSSKDASETELAFKEAHPFQIGAPTLDQMGERVETEININRTTSNIDELLASAPSHMTYNVIGRTSPDAGVEQHFVLDTSVLDLAMEFVMPLDFKCSEYSLQDTIEFGLGEEGIDTSFVKQLEIYLTTLNELPLQLEVQVYFMDGTYNVVDSLFNDTSVLLEAATLDADGKLLQAMEETNIASLSTAKLGNLENTEYAMIQARVITSGGGDQFVKLYTHYSLDFELAIYGKFRLNTREMN